MSDEQLNTSHALPENHKDWLLTQAFTRLQQRQFVDALKLLQGLRVLAPCDAEVYRMLSYALLSVDQPEECLMMVDKYLQHIPSETDTEAISWIQERAKARLEKAQSDGSEQQSEES